MIDHPIRTDQHMIKIYPQVLQEIKDKYNNNIKYKIKTMMDNIIILIKISIDDLEHKYKNDAIYDDIEILRSRIYNMIDKFMNLIEENSDIIDDDISSYKNIIFERIKIFELKIESIHIFHNKIDDKIDDREEWITVEKIIDNKKSSSWGSWVINKLSMGYI